MAIKLIATDLDGTLMYTDHTTITPFTLDVLKQAHDKGVKIAIATGRPLALIDNVIEQIPFCDYIIYANGACVFDRKSNGLIYSNLIPNKDAVEAIKHYLALPVFFEVYVDGRSQYQFGQDKYFENTDFPSDFIEEAKATMDGHEDLIEYLGDKPIEKITLYGVTDDIYSEYEKKMLELKFNTACSFVGCLEGTVGTADKGVALKGLADALGIDASEVMSFGDAGNDIPMLEFADYSFAMGNATEECKKSAKFIAKSNGEDGLAIEVKKYVLD